VFKPCAHILLSFCISILSLVLLTRTNVACSELQNSISSLPKPLEKGLRHWTNRLSHEIDELNPLNGGGAVAVVYKGQVIYEAIYGNRNLGSGKIDRNTLFRVGSVSKTFVGAAIARLVAKDKISLRDPVASIFPGINPKVQVIHLLTHSSGYLFLGDPQIERGEGRDKLIQKLIASKPTHPPGNFFQYNNTVFSLIQEYLSRKLGHPWQEEVRLLAQDLGISDLSLCEPPKPNRFALPHSFNKGQFTASTNDCTYCKTVCTSGGIYTSLQGMTEFLKSIMGYKDAALDSKARAILFEPQKPNIQDTKIFTWPINLHYPKKLIRCSYGLGTRTLEISRPKSRFIFHPGYLKGARSFIGFFPDLEIGIVFLSTQDAPVFLQLGIDFWADLTDAAT
jgi:beta-lactamase class C